MKNLITSLEVISKAPAGHNYDPHLLKSFITDAQFFLCDSKCFGDDFYQDILSTLVDAEIFDACKSYFTDEVVIYGGLYYKALNPPPVGTLPTEPACWTVTNKFTNADYQELWDCGLWEYMAFSVLHYAILSSAIRAETVGVMQNSTDYSQPASIKGIMLLKNDLQNRRETRFRSMNKFLTRVNEAQGIDNVTRYPLYPPNEESLCGCNPCDKDNAINIPMIKNRWRKYKERCNRCERGYAECRCNHKDRSYTNC